MTNEDILTEFPSIYKHKGMFDFSPPPGWLPLIHQLSTDLLPHKVKAVQVKSKLGEMRYYVVGVSDPTPRELIHIAEQKSRTICETCGEPGVRVSMPSGWVRVACDKHKGE